MSVEGNMIIVEFWWGSGILGVWGGYKYLNERLSYLFLGGLLEVVVLWVVLCFI